MSTFVLEIGTEELPARFLKGEEQELQLRFKQALSDYSIEYESIRVMSTPRRAVVILNGVNPVQLEKEEEISGPPSRIAYVNGEPTKALEGFLRTNSISLDSVYTVMTEKGEYIAARKHTGGAPVSALLAQICPEIISSIPFAKRMKWGNQTFAYARPLRWILALFDSEIVSFQVGPVKSSNFIYGHRIHGAGPFTVSSANDYIKIVTESASITPDSADRRAFIISEGEKLASEVHGIVQWKESLLDEVQGLCEHPVPVLGKFDDSYLEIPAEVLLTSMESHQKSFGLRNEQGTLLPYFLTVANLTPQDVNIVRHGWERVLKARLEDAAFFWRQDMSDNFDAWLEKLDNVIFIGRLGSVGEKTRRLEQLCSWLAERCDKTISSKDAARAGRLSKSDLVSGMVGEFDTLQGIMGGIYAEKKGESPNVSNALKEQYLPAGPDTDIPSTKLGAILSMADKADTLVGCFGLGMIPTGTADSNGLRRCALGIIRILLDYGFDIDIHDFLAKAQSLYGEREWKLSEADALSKLEEFFRDRIKNFFQGKGIDTLTVEAAMPKGNIDLRRISRCIQALQNFSSSDDYISAVQTFKRVSNIIAKHGNPKTSVWQDSLLKEAAEIEFANCLKEFLPQFDKAYQDAQYSEMFSLLKLLRVNIDNFFNKIMVMCDDAAIAENRCCMLFALLQRLSKAADFTALKV